MDEQKDRYKIPAMAIFLIAACIFTYYFHAVLKTDAIFTHFFYIPIILAAFWWKIKGTSVAIFLAALLFLSDFFIQPDVLTANDFLRSLMLVVIAFIVAILCERLAKAQEELQKHREHLEELVEDRTDELQREIGEHKSAEGRIAHLNLVLHAIRNVNQLVTKEHDRGRLLQGACDNLIETRGYHTAWIALMDKSGTLITTAEAGLGEAFVPMVKRLEHGELIECGQKALLQSKVVVIDDPISTCVNCPLMEKYDDRKAMTTRLEHGGRFYGLFSVAVPAKLAADREEQVLFAEVAGDIAFALHNLQQEEKRKRAEDALRKSVAELERSNTDLEQFAYVASHDLQEPLRMVSSYVQLLKRRYTGKLDSDADDFIDFAVDGANRMQVLIEDLLAYSRVGTRGRPFEPTDCTLVLDQVLANLEVAIDESDAGVTHDPMPTVAVDGSQLAQVFQNLIGNAIKFRGDEPPRVHIAAEQKDGEWEFFVADNGIGIKPEFFERIFVIFQRLHSREEYSGTGIGLAVCKKIVERHGGRMWVESEPGQGATFYFTIPVRGGEEG